MNTDSSIEAHHPNSDGQVLLRWATAAICTHRIVNGQVVIPGEELEKKKTDIVELVDEVETLTEQFVDNYVEAIRKVAGLLLQKKRLTGREVSDIVASG